MAGVAGPMLRRDKLQGTRFLTGLLVGGSIASLLLAAVLFGLGTLLEWWLPPHARLVAVAVSLVLLGLADIANRTPHTWRQVPQAYVRSIPPGRLGLVWGFDLSLLFTTQKSTSLTWAALAGTGLLVPSAAGYVLVGMTVLGVLTIAVRSVYYSVNGMPDQGDRIRPWFTLIRRTCGVALLAVAAVVTLGNW
ncbi:hypothetical protein [Streptomyces afghaniensis]|uniref:hypothetical protein n=1 Tax=Streptomyces afghaniensis TaxID=66865 RepID=UPI002787AD59|nr:hypothetical protein [Streptomyces afghaniensis]MDQ1018614.1 hypothetical protein [Streptomyces afghaniensis]